MYKHLVNNRVKITHEILHMELPLKMKKKTWHFKRGIILTKDNLVRRNLNGSFCSKLETIQHSLNVIMRSPYCLSYTWC